MEFLKKKWAYHFETLDLNKHGKITRADVDETLKRFPEVEGLSESEGKMANEKIEKWWNTYFLKGKDEVTEDDYIRDLEQQYKDDKEGFKAFITATMKLVVSVIDADHTGSISLDNYVKAFKVIGHDNEGLLRKAFQMYKPENQMLSVEEYCQDWIIFLTNDDPTKEDVVLGAYEAGLQ